MATLLRETCVCPGLADLRLEKCKGIDLTMRIRKSERGADPLPASLSGVSGEYFVAAELSRRGYVAAMTLKNTRGVDLLASRLGGRSAATIQVKSKKGMAGEWTLSIKDERSAGPRHFYVFVALRNLETPEYFVVPSQVVAKRCREHHRQWIRVGKRDGSARKNTTMRSFRPDQGSKSRWDLLGL